MKAVGYRATGSTDVLVDIDLPKPIPGPRDLLDEVADLVDAGLIRTTMNTNLGVINAANVRRAHAIAESGTSIGKLVLSGFERSA